MADADQARHRLHAPAVPAGPAPLQPQPQRLGLTLYHTAANRPTLLQHRRIVQPAHVFLEIADELVCRLAAAFAFSLIFDGQQLGHSHADTRPALGQQQTLGPVEGSPRGLGPLPEDPFGTQLETEK